MTRGTFGRAGSTLALGYAGEQGLLFLRTVLVARFLGPEHFGIAVTFMLVVSTFTLISDMGFEKYLIQVRESELVESRDTLATLLLLRGLLLGTTIVLASGLIATGFGHPDLAWFYACAGLVPIVEGFRHLDPMEQQRRMHFAAVIKMKLGGLIPGVLLTIVLAAMTESYVAIAAGALATSVISVALSHLLAGRRYLLRFHRGSFAAILSYGWPLLLNGFVIVLGSQGDRIVVGTLGSMTELAGYAAVSALTAGASIFIARLSGNLGLPLLSEVKDRPQLFAERCRTTGAAAVLLLSACIMPLALIGAPLVYLLFGPGYATPPLLAAFLAILAAATVLRGWCVVIPLSLGRTGDILTANIVRSLGLAGAALSLASGKDIVWVAASMCAGDVAATIFQLWRAGVRTPLAARACLVFGAIFAALAAVAISLNLLFDPYDQPVLALLGAIGLAGLGAAAALLSSGDLRRRLLQGLTQLRSKARLGSQ